MILDITPPSEDSSRAVAIIYHSTILLLEAPHSKKLLNSIYKLSHGVNSSDRYAQLAANVAPDENKQIFRVQRSSGNPTTGRQISGRGGREKGRMHRVSDRESLESFGRRNETAYSSYCNAVDVLTAHRNAEERRSTRRGWRTYSCPWPRAAPSRPCQRSHTWSNGGTA